MVAESKCNTKMHVWSCLTPRMVHTGSRDGKLTKWKCFWGSRGASCDGMGNMSVGMVLVNPIRHIANAGRMSLVIWCELVKRDSSSISSSYRWKRCRPFCHCSTACRIFRGSIYWVFFCLFLHSTKVCVCRGQVLIIGGCLRITFRGITLHIQHRSSGAISHS